MGWSNRRGCLVLASWSLAGIALGCGAEAKDDQEPNVIHIGLLADFEDVAATQRQSAQLLVGLRTINEAGGVKLLEGDYQLDLIAEDHGRSVEGVVAAMQRLADQGVTATIGPAWSSLVLGNKPDHSDGAGAKARELGMLLISGDTTAAALSELDDDGLFWRTVPSDTVQGKMGAEYLYKEEGARSAAVIYRADAWGSGLAATFEAEFAALGGRVLASVSYDPARIDDLETHDFSELLDTAFADHPDAVYFVNFEEFFTITNTLVQGRYLSEYPPGAPQLFGTDGVYVEDLITNLAPEILDRLQGTIASSDPSSPDYQLMVQLMLEEGLAASDADDAVRYDAALLLALAMQAAQSTDARLIKQHMRDVSRADPGDVEVHLDDWALARDTLLAGGTVNYEGASGSIEFDDNGDRTQGAIAIWGITREANGAYVVNADRVIPYEL